MSGTGSVSALELTTSASGITGSVSTSTSISALALTLAAVGVYMGVATGEVTASAVTVGTSIRGPTGQVSYGDVFAPTGSVYATGELPYVFAEEAEVTGAGITGRVGTASINLAENVITISGAGVTGATAYSVIRTIPGQVYGTSGIEGDIQVPEPLIEAEGATGRTGYADVFALPGTVTGDTDSDRTATGSILARALTVSGSGLAEIVAQGSITAPTLTVAGAGLTGRAGSADITVPLLTVDAAGGVYLVGSAEILVPLPVVSGTGESSVGVALAASLSGIAVNTRIRAVTEYTGLSILSLCQMGDTILAATDEGIVALTGDTDLSEPFEFEVMSGISDFGKTEIKKIPTAYVSGRLSEDVKMSIRTDTNMRRYYRLKEMKSGMQAHRALFGLGVFGRHWQWSLNGAAPGSSVSGISFDVTLSKRRII